MQKRKKVLCVNNEYFGFSMIIKYLINVHVVNYKKKLEISAKVIYHKNEDYVVMLQNYKKLTRLTT